MSTIINKKNYVSFGLIVILISILIFISPISKATNIIQGNYNNVTVNTRLSISNSKPQILALAVYQETNSSAPNITISAGTTRNVTCNASVRDFNGFADVASVNATFWYTPTSSSNAADDNNTHYTVNCTNESNGVNYTINYDCVLPVYYYANNGSWTCNATAKDSFNTTGYLFNTTYLYPVYALNITDTIDYGSIAVDLWSRNTTANITNFGNMAINVSIQSYGAVLNDGLAMNCSLNGNITTNNQLFSPQNVSKISTTGNIQSLVNLTIAKQTVFGTPGLKTNITTWTLFVNSTNNPAGNCTGFVTFIASAP